MLKFFLLLWAIPFTLAVQAADLDYPNRYGSMANSMFDMMDAFSSAYQKRTGTDSRSQAPASNAWPQGGMPWSQNALSWGQSSIPWSMGGMPWTSGGTPWSPGSMPWTQSGMSGAPGFGQQMLPSFGAGNPSLFGQGPSASSPLDGSWRGRSGEVLVIGNGRFRIYLNRDDYREGRLLLSGKDRIAMQDPSSGLTRQYRYAEHQGRLALQDERGALLLYRRIE
jgi:hypothetical protein